MISSVDTVTPSSLLICVALAVTPSRIFISEAEAVTPASLFNSVAVAVTAVPPICNEFTLI